MEASSLVNAHRLLNPDAQRLWTIPAGVPFLQVLAKGLATAAGLADNPDALQNAVVYVPNRRSARTLALELLHAAGESATILPPDIRALGDLESDEAPHGAEEALAALGPLLPEAKRTGTLMRLVMEFYERSGETIALPSALAAAQALGALLDQAAIAGLEDWSGLDTLVSDQALAHHWERSTEFLKIIAVSWPDWLEEQGAMDPLARRAKAAEALAAHWQANPPDGPLIIAGSTGSTPASLALMRAALALPNGRVILPGLDRDAAPDDWDSIGRTPNHHQSALASTLDALRTTSSQVPVWPIIEGDQPARRRLIHEALAPAERTGDWRSRIEELAEGQSPEAAVADALSGFTLVEADDEAHEAQLAALLMRQSLEETTGNTALVTPDTALARRVSALLKRWSIDAAPSAGAPLMRTPEGLALATLLAWWQAPDDPVHLAALLKSSILNPAGPENTKGLESSAVDLLEKKVMRGPKRWSSLEGLAKRCADHAPARACVEHLSAALANVAGPSRRAGLEWSSALSALVEALGATGTLWRGGAGLAAAKLVDDTAGLLHAFSDHDLATFAQMVLTRGASVVVPPATAGHPRLSIWGPLEARLQKADHMILAGLNEDVWPRRPGADPFLPAHFKTSLGLPDPEERMGLMAHDFAGLACSPRVTCLYAARRGDAPAVASRWIWRLKTLVRGAGAEAALNPSPDDDPRPWAEALWTVPPSLKVPDRFAEPRPRPPVESRPERLSVTRIDWLQRDPYAIYAEAVLGLRRLDPLAKPVGPAERGVAIHSALERVGRGDIPAEPDSLAAAIETALADAGLDPAALAAGRALTRQTAEWCLEWLSGRPWLAERNGRVAVEVKGTLELDIAGAPFTLSAMADRIEIGGGSAAIVDFKTGTPPTDSQIEVGLAQQMPLQALIAMEGGFEGLPPAPVSDLVYVAFKAKPDARSLREPPDALASAAKEGLIKLITAYRDPAQAFLSAPRVQFVGYDYGYNRLARRAEWVADTRDE